MPTDSSTLFKKKFEIRKKIGSAFNFQVKQKRCVQYSVTWLCEQLKIEKKTYKKNANEFNNKICR